MACAISITEFALAPHRPLSREFMLGIGYGGRATLLGFVTNYTTNVSSLTIPILFSLVPRGWRFGFSKGANARDWSSESHMLFLAHLFQGMVLILSNSP